MRLWCRQTLFECAGQAHTVRKQYECQREGKSAQTSRPAAVGGSADGSASAEAPFSSQAKLCLVASKWSTARAQSWQRRGSKYSARRAAVGVQEPRTRKRHHERCRTSQVLRSSSSRAVFLLGVNCQLSLGADRKHFPSLSPLPARVRLEQRSVRDEKPLSACLESSAGLVGDLLGEPDDGDDFSAGPSHRRGTQPVYSVAKRPATFPSTRRSPRRG